MIPDNYLQLIDSLIEKTKSGKAIWNKTSGENEFMLKLKEGAITVDNFSRGGYSYVDLAIYNDKGEKIDRIVYGKTTNFEDYTKLDDLHSLARRKYYKVDQTIDSIFKEISSDDSIGQEPESSEDLPF